MLPVKRDGHFCQFRPVASSDCRFLQPPPRGITTWFSSQEKSTDGLCEQHVGSQNIGLGHPLGPPSLMIIGSCQGSHWRFRTEASSSVKSSPLTASRRLTAEALWFRPPLTNDAQRIQEGIARIFFDYFVQLPVVRPQECLKLRILTQQGSPGHD